MESLSGYFGCYLFFGIPFAIGPYEEKFVDGGLGANNPAYTMRNQAQDLWGEDRLQDKLLLNAYRIPLHGNPAGGVI